MPEYKEGMEGENTRGEKVPNYSQVPAINRVYNSREAIVAGGGLQMLMSQK